jgi:hypothetical protein
VYAWPPFSAGERADLDAFRFKLVHYLSKLDVDVCYFMRNSGGLTQCRYNIRRGDVIERSEVTYLSAKHQILRSRYSVLWKFENSPRYGSLRPHLYYVAEGPQCHGATDWLRLVSDLYFSEHPWPNRVIPFPKVPVKSCAVLGSGPSVDCFGSEGGRYEAWIGANGLALDERVRRAGTPFAFCIMDPYYFAPADSTTTIWNAVFELLRSTSAVFVTTSNAAGFIELNFPEEIKRKCHYVRTLGRDTCRLHTRFSLPELTVTPYGNVLTDLMLPIAASISRQVVLYGCDGAPPGATSNFPKSSYLQASEDALAGESAPIVDESYYSTYFDSFSAYTHFVVQECKVRGIEIFLRTPSWNAGLRSLPVLPNETATVQCRATR